MRLFDFQIGAMPRSGSAWVATALNFHKEIFCYHDALQSAPGSYRDASEAKNEYEYVGDCSSGACLFPEYPTKKVFIYRDPLAVFASLEAVGLGENFLEVREACLKWAKGALVIPFEDLFSKDENLSCKTFCEILDYVAPTVCLDLNKWRHLHPLKVELLNLSPQTYRVDEIARRMTWQ